MYTWHLGLVSVRRPPALQVSSGNHGSYRMRNKPCTTSSLGSLDFRWGDGLVGRFQWVTLSVCVCVFLVCQKESHWFGVFFVKSQWLTSLGMIDMTSWIDSSLVDCVCFLKPGGFLFAVGTRGWTANSYRHGKSDRGSFFPTKPWGWIWPY